MNKKLILMSLACFLAFIVITTNSTLSSQANQCVRSLHIEESTCSLSYNDFISSGYTIIIFYEDWCNPCNRMAPIFEDLASQMPHITFLKVNRTMYRHLFDFYNLKTVPAILFFKNGALIKKQLNSVNRKKMRRLIYSAFGI
jgi:thiol-disulfide isomerase/thioredoxin